MQIKVGPIIMLILVIFVAKISVDSVSNARADEPRVTRVRQPIVQSLHPSQGSFDIDQKMGRPD